MIIPYFLMHRILVSGKPANIVIVPDGIPTDIIWSCRQNVRILIEEGGWFLFVRPL